MTVNSSAAVDLCGNCGEPLDEYRPHVCAADEQAALLGLTERRYKISLRILRAELVRYIVERDPEAPGSFRSFIGHVDTMAEAQGVMFLCPLCFLRNNGSRRTHMVICWSRSAGAPDEASPGPGRWRLAGKGLGDLSLEPDREGKGRSVALQGGCNWHGFVTSGHAHG